MQVRLIKKHVKGGIGDILTVSDARGKYLVSIKAAEASSESGKPVKQVKKPLAKAVSLLNRLRSL